MDMPPDHRKLVKHVNEPGEGHELTFSCFQRRALLTDERWLQLLTESIDSAVEKQGFDLNAFVFMPEHVHLLVFPRHKSAEVESLLYAIKRPFSYRVKQVMLATKDSLVSELSIRERPGKTVFRFWQEGPGYDRNIRSVQDAIVAADYIHNNPVRRGLCQCPQQYRWSSWAYYHSPETINCDLPKVSVLRA